MPRRGVKLAKHSTGAAVSIVSMPFKDLRHAPIQLGILHVVWKGLAYQRGLTLLSWPSWITFTPRLLAASR